MSHAIPLAGAPNFDFNTAPKQHDHGIDYDLHALSDALASTAMSWVPSLFPNGKRVDDEWVLGGIDGRKARKAGSCKINLRGRFAGAWKDWDDGDGGGPIDTVRQATGLDGRDLYQRCAEMTGSRGGEPLRHGRTYRPSGPIDRTNEIAFVMQNAVPAAGSVVETAYFPGRGLPWIACPDLWYSPDVANFAVQRGFPVMIAKLRNAAGELVNAIHRTYLQDDGAGKADVPKAKMMLGDVRGSTLHLVEMGADGRLSTCEGIETGAAAHHIFGLPVWPALSTSGIIGFEFPEGLKHLTLFADAGHAGQGLIEKLSNRCKLAGIRFDTVTAIHGDDFADDLVKGAVRGDYVGLTPWLTAAPELSAPGAVVDDSGAPAWERVETPALVASGGGVPMDFEGLEKLARQLTRTSPAAMMSELIGYVVAARLGPMPHRRILDAIKQQTGMSISTLEKACKAATKVRAAAPASAGNGSPFRLVASGVEHRSEDDETGEVVWTWFCSRLHIEAFTRDAEGQEWGCLLGVEDRDGKFHEWAMPMGMLAGFGNEYRERLLGLGLVLSAAKNARQLLEEYIQTARPDGRARCVSRIGWHGRAFVLPDATVGDTAGETVLLQTAAKLDHAFRRSGTIEGWRKNISGMAASNSRLVLAISAAFAAPLLHVTGSESGGFHMRGASSTGKSTALIVAGSVWGGGGVKGFIKQWRATANGLEGLASAHCDVLLCLDELSQIDAKEAGQAAYLIANGAGKSRAGRDGEARATAEWRSLFLSNGEIGLADKLAEDGRGKRVAAGQQVRVVDLRADAGAGLGLFDTLHGAPDADTFARHLKTAASEHHGHAARAFLEALTDDLDGMGAAAVAARNKFVSDNCPPASDGQVTRVCQRFGLVAAAGELATMAGITGWGSGEAIRAAARCFHDWLELRGGTGSAEIAAGIAQVRAFIEQHGSSRFESAWERNNQGDPSDKPIFNRAGFRDRVRNGDGTEWDFYILPEAWKGDVCRGSDPKAIAKAMVEAGLLVPGLDGKTAALKAVPGHGRARLYHVKAAIMRGD